MYDSNIDKLGTIIGFVWMGDRLGTPRAVGKKLLGISSPHESHRASPTGQ
jgi:hypothetical protein